MRISIRKQLNVCCICSEVERELGLLFSKGGKRGLGIGSKAKQPRAETSFNMFVEDIRDGVLVSINP